MARAGAGLWLSWRAHLSGGGGLAEQRQYRPLTETPFHVPQGGVCPILYLTEIIRPNDPSMQRVCRAVEDARARTELLPTAWTLARVLTVDIVESVLTARAPCPPPCPPAHFICKVTDNGADYGGIGMGQVVKATYRY